MKENNGLITKFRVRKIRIVDIKNNSSTTVKTYKKASIISNVSISMIKKIINDSNKSSNGYRFYSVID